nr:efflux RND transporter periplasmic adaptor subunit [Roseospira visakhapatnamensis]
MPQSFFGLFVKQINYEGHGTADRTGTAAPRLAAIVGALGIAGLGLVGVIGVPTTPGHAERTSPPPGTSPGTSPETSHGLAPVPIARPVPTAIVEYQPAAHVRAFPGSVRAARRVDLAFSVPGVLEALNAQEGRSLGQGAVVAALDQRDYQNALDAAEARYVKAERDLVRARTLWDKRVGSKASYEDAQAARDIALAELRIREKALEDTVLLAPFDGLVARRHIETHEHIEAKQTIVSFQDLSSIEVVIQVPERVIAHGGPEEMGALRVRFDADDSRWFEAAVHEYSAQADPVTRTYDVVVALAPPSDLTVFPGMTATVQARIDGRTPPPRAPAPALTRIPVEALWRGHDGLSYVWVIDPDGSTPAKRRVEAVALVGDGVQIRDGLTPGEHVATAGLHSLRESLWVRPMVPGARGLDG